MKEDTKVYLSRVCSGPLAEQWVNLEQLYDKKLYHELTIELLKFVKHEHFQQNGGLLELYENFLSTIEHRINPLSFTEIMLVISGEVKEYEKALELFSKVEEKIKTCVEGKVLCLITKGSLHLKANKLDLTKEAIKSAETLLDTLDGVTTVHARFYDLSSNYSKIVGAYNEFYKDALRYLGCLDITELKGDELRQRAFNLSLAALLGNEVYNFGELLAHDVLEYLKGTEHAWLIDVLFAFNSGNIQKFLDMKSKWAQQPDLAANETALLQKITLLCLMELAFSRKSTDRSFSFDAVAKETRLPVNEVELLVMKALSLGLIKGTIDEVEKMIHITWVQPRVLDKDQIGKLRELIGLWGEKVKSSVYLVEEQVPELMVN
ncbi:26S proteasome non-ATPase regulatory subunit 13-like [Clytia hemisphaerica]|uniref:26S proteasome non-ATPase regulatory subunit 13 n=1 Tax=Clytia hemisphaerica TaxID=252671 RepID=A0A7M6DPA8_9CNID|eukprot:TCONS_00055422-protein